MKVRLDEYMLQSAAWQHASPLARCLLIELMRLHNGYNNGDICLSVREAARRLRVGKNTANRAFNELEGLGFIKPRQRGAFSLKVRHATAWILTMYGVPQEPIPGNEFMHWQPSETPNGKQKSVPQYGDRECQNTPAH